MPEPEHADSLRLIVATIDNVVTTMQKRANVLPALHDTPKMRLLAERFHARHKSQTETLGFGRIVPGDVTYDRG